MIRSSAVKTVPTSIGVKGCYPTFDSEIISCKSGIQIHVLKHLTSPYNAGIGFFYYSKFSLILTIENMKNFINVHHFPTTSSSQIRQLMAFAFCFIIINYNEYLLSWEKI